MRPSCGERSRIAAVVGAAMWVAGLGVGCGAVDGVERGTTAWVDGSVERWPASRGAIRVRWTDHLVPTIDDAYLPVERATPAIDELRGRVYAASTAGTLWALHLDGRRVYRYVAGSAFEAGPVLDATQRELYAVTADGFVHSLNARDGSVRWKVDSTAGSTSQPPVLTTDAVYVTSDADQVVALSRADGAFLWRYKREPTDAYRMVGHAGIRLTAERLYAAFSDGAVVALDPSDGRVLWERDTSLDFPPGEVGRGQRFADVDTAPTLGADGHVYVASFSGGLYALDAANGSVAAQRTDMTGITSVTAVGADLLLVAADGTMRRWDPASGATRWLKRVARGNGGHPVLVGDVIYLGESKGGLVARHATTGAELSRLQSGYGFSASLAVLGARGFVMSNGGTLHALQLAN